MTDFCGKRGRSWHISTVTTRATVESKHEVQCFVHIFDNCTQNNFAVLFIIEDLLRKIKQEYPFVTSAYLRSDNEECGIRVWKAYNIGPRHLIPYSDLGVPSQGDTGLRVIKPFGQQSGSVGKNVRHKSNIYSCQETGCILTFKTQAEAENHMDTGRHCLAVDCESMHDHMRTKWAGTLTGVTFAPNVPSTSSQGMDSSSPARASACRPFKWTLKVAK